MHHAQAIIGKAKANAYFAHAVDTEEYRSAIELRDQALAQREALPAVNPPAEPTNGAELDSWLHALVDTRTAEQNRELQYTALMTLINSCNRRIESVITMSPDTVLRKLSDALTELLGEITATIPNLRGATTPSAVIATGVGDVWQELHSLRQCYDQLRDAQRFVMADELAHHSSDYLYDDPHASRLYIRDIDDVFPGWRRPDNTIIQISTVTEDPRPWPTNDKVEQLIWLATHCQLWIPTRSDLSELQRELHQKNNPEPVEEPKPRHKKQRTAFVG